MNPIVQQLMGLLGGGGMPQQQPQQDPRIAAMAKLGGGGRPPMQNVPMLPPEGREQAMAQAPMPPNAGGPRSPDMDILDMIQQHMGQSEQRGPIKKDATEPEGDEYQWEGNPDTEGPTDNDIQYMNSNPTDGVLQDFNQYFGITPNVNWRNIDDMNADMEKTDRTPEQRRYQYDPDLEEEEDK